MGRQPGTARALALLLILSLSMGLLLDVAEANNRRRHRRRHGHGHGHGHGPAATTALPTATQQQAAKVRPSFKPVLIEADVGAQDTEGVQADADNFQASPKKGEHDSSKGLPDDTTTTTTTTTNTTTTTTTTTTNPSKKKKHHHDNNGNRPTTPAVAEAAVVLNQTLADGTGIACPADSYGAIAWPAAEAGSTVVLDCPAGSVGSELRVCCGAAAFGAADGFGNVCTRALVGTWLLPDRQNCKSLELEQLVVGLALPNPESVLAALAATHDLVLRLKDQLGLDDVLNAQAALAETLAALERFDMPVLDAPREPVLRGFAAIVSALLDGSNDVLGTASALGQAHFGEDLPALVERLVRGAMQQLEAGGRLGEVNVVEPNVVVSVFKRSMPRFGGLTWPSPALTRQLVAQGQAFDILSVPRDAFAGPCCSNVTGTFGVVNFGTAKLFRGSYASLSPVLSASVYGLEGTYNHLASNVTLAFAPFLTPHAGMQLRQQLARAHADLRLEDIDAAYVEAGPDGAPRLGYSFWTQPGPGPDWVRVTRSDPAVISCRWWDAAADDWSDRGCTLRGIGTQDFTCECEHLTTFAVVVETAATAETARVSFVFSAACVLAMVVLAVITMAHLLLWREKWVTLPAFSVTNLSFALFGAYLCLLLGVRRRSLDDSACLTVAWFEYFFLLVSCCWLLADGILLYFRSLKLQPHQKTLGQFIKAYFLFTWTICLVITFVTFESDNHHFITSSYCWIDESSKLIGAFLAPVGLVLIAFMGCVATAAFSANDDATPYIPIGATAAIFLTMVITWTAAIMVIASDLLAYQYIFALAAVMHAALMFYYYCWTNEEVLDSYRDMFRRGSYAVRPSPPGHFRSQGSKQSLYGMPPPKFHEAVLDDSVLDSIKMTGWTHATTPGPTTTQGTTTTTTTTAWSSTAAAPSGTPRWAEVSSSGLKQGGASPGVSPLAPSGAAKGSPALETWSPNMPSNRSWFDSPRKGRENPFSNESTPVPKPAMDSSTRAPGPVPDSPQDSPPMFSPPNVVIDDSVIRQSGEVIVTEDKGLSSRSTFSPMTTSSPLASTSQMSTQAQASMSAVAAGSPNQKPPTQTHVSTFMKGLASRARSGTPNFSSPSLSNSGRRPTGDLVSFYSAKSKARGQSPAP